MRAKHKTGFLLALVMMSILCFSVVPVWAEPQGTDGTELQVAQPEQLEIQLGAEWAGVEFQMKTDAGLYPGTIPVSQDGVLRLEIGGSKSYVLTCLNSAAKAPSDAGPCHNRKPAGRKNRGKLSGRKGCNGCGHSGTSSLPFCRRHGSGSRRADHNACHQKTERGRGWLWV